MILACYSAVVAVHFCDLNRIDSGRVYVPHQGYLIDKAEAHENLFFGRLAIDDQRQKAQFKADQIVGLHFRN